MKKRREFYIVLAVSVAFSLMMVMPPRIFAQTEKGIQLYNAWEYQEAEKVLRSALKTNPQDITADFYLGLSVLLQGKYDEALNLFQKVKVERENAAQTSASLPDAYQIQIGLARANLGLEKYAEAWKNLETAEKLNAALPDVYVYRGVYYLRKDDNGKAIKELEKAIKMDPDNVYAHYYAGHAYLRSGNPARAVDMFKNFIELAPDAPEVPKAKALIDALC